MANKSVLNVVTTQCQAQDEEKFNQWYNEVHVPLLLKFKGITAVARYKVMVDKTALPQYVAIYRFPSFQDFEKFGGSPELQAAADDLAATWGKKISIISRVQYELIKEWQK